VSTFQRVVLFLWAGLAMLLLVSSVVELWLLLEGAVRKPHNSRLTIFFAFALGAAIAASVFGAWRGRKDAFSALQTLSVLFFVLSMLVVIGFVLQLITALTAEVRDWSWQDEMPALLSALFMMGFALATRFAFRARPTEPNDEPSG